MPRSPLFLTRKFPPSVGGMETLAAGVWRGISAAEPDAVLVAHGGSNARMPLWLPSALLRLVRLARAGRVRFVLTGDALMYVIARPILRLLRLPGATMVMGLDVTYDRWWYQAVVRRALRRAPHVLAISEATAEAVRSRGVDAGRIGVVPLGVAFPDVAGSDRSAARATLRQRIGAGEGDAVLLTLGRVVRRKGAAWFVREVWPGLPDSVHYVVAGDGEDMPALRAARDAAPRRQHIHLLGSVDEQDREALLRGADLFVQPNIRVEGDMEGYGLVTIEAGGRGTPVVAAALEGILDAVEDGETGILLPAEDAAAWVDRIKDLVADTRALDELGDRFRARIVTSRSEAAMGSAIVAAITRPGER